MSDKMASISWPQRGLDKRHDATMVSMTMALPIASILDERDRKGLKRTQLFSVP
jgi:hypothetical protein